MAFDESWLPVTAAWLADPGLARLTMSGRVTPEAQRAWFDALPGRADYAVWGIEYDGEKAGVMGLKGIGDDDGGEYFMYLGDQRFWGRGIARWAFHEIADEARSRGLRYLYGRVHKQNERSLAVDLRHGFEIVRDEGESWWIACPLFEPGLRRVAFDETFLDRSLVWLADPETARLTMTEPVTPESQHRWYDDLAGRTDYAVWGIAEDGVPIGAMGLKHIGDRDGAEYFMYIGERDRRGRGVATWAFAEICAEVRSRGLSYLYGVIGKHNEHSLAVHVRQGLVVVGETDTEWLLALRL